MDSSLLLSAFLSGLAGGIIAILVTRAIERFKAVGAVLGTSPTTVVAASIGLMTRLADSSTASSSSSSLPNNDAIRRAMYSVCPGMLLNGLFLLWWRFLPTKLPSPWSFKKRLLTMIAVSMSFWAAGAAALVAWMRSLQSVEEVVLFGSCCAGLLFVTGCILTWIAHIEPPKAAAKPVPWKMLLLRSSMAFLAIGSCVLLSKLSDIAAGFASTFPAIFLTSMVGLWLSQGEATPTSAVGPMLLGSISVSAYAIIFGELSSGQQLDVLGRDPYACAAVSWLLAVLTTSLPIGLYFRRRANKFKGATQLEEEERDVAAQRAAVVGGAGSGAAALQQPPLAGPSGKNVEDEIELEGQLGQPQNGKGLHSQMR